MNETVCNICAKPGVTEWTVLHARRPTTLMLCKIHGDQLRAFWNYAPDTAHRYANPGDRPLDRRWITARSCLRTRDDAPLDYALEA